ncbi:MAG TPA: response regulator [Dissulfurispiraceae bacterium]|nr:response regulator [Dissulfurispiraceae bacterium]
MKRRILIVDRDPFFLRSATTMLRSAGYRVRAVPTAEKALTLLARSGRTRHPFDLLFFDTNRTGMSARQFGDELSKRDIPVPLLTVSESSDKSFFIDMLDNGHYEFLEHIFSCGDMNRRIRKKACGCDEGVKTPHQTEEDTGVPMRTTSQTIIRRSKTGRRLP